MKKLKDLIERCPRWLAFVGLLPVAIGYLLINHFPVFAPRYLPFLFGEAYLIFYAMCVAHLLIFTLFPTIYPRAVSEDVFFVLIKSVDPPNNCFPSMHVSISIFWRLWF
jgi:hypothetical protein